MASAAPAPAAPTILQYYTDFIRNNSVNFNPFDYVELHENIDKIAYIDGEFQSYRMPIQTEFLETPNYFGDATALTPIQFLLSFGAYVFDKVDTGYFNKKPILYFELFDFLYKRDSKFNNPQLLHANFVVASSPIKDLLNEDGYNSFMGKDARGNLVLPFLDEIELNELATVSSAAEAAEAAEIAEIVQRMLTEIKDVYNTYCSTVRTLMTGEFRRFHGTILMNGRALMITKGPVDFYAMFNTCKLLGLALNFRCKWLDLDANNYVDPITKIQSVPGSTPGSTPGFLENKKLNTYCEIYNARYIFTMKITFNFNIKDKLRPFTLDGDGNHNPLYDAYLHMIMHNGMAFDSLIYSGRIPTESPPMCNLIDINFKYQPSYDKTVQTRYNPTGDPYYNVYLYAHPRAPNPAPATAIAAIAAAATAGGAGGPSPYTHPLPPSSSASSSATPRKYKGGRRSRNRKKSIRRLSRRNKKFKKYI